MIVKGRHNKQSSVVIPGLLSKDHSLQSTLCRRAAGTRDYEWQKPPKKTVMGSIKRAHHAQSESSISSESTPPHRSSVFVSMSQLLLVIKIVETCTVDCSK